MPIKRTAWLAGSHFRTRTIRSVNMGKVNNPQKNDKKGLKPKQNTMKTVTKK